MRCLQAPLLTLVLFWLSAAERCCDFSNEEYVTRIAIKVLDTMKPGIPGLLKPLDPLHEDRIEGEMFDIKYELTNVTLSGMNHCQVGHLAINSQLLTFVYTIRCPRFVITGHYAAKGTLDTKPIDHDGNFQTTINDYTVNFNGIDVRFVDEIDQKVRIIVKDYEITAENEGKVTFDNNVLRQEDKEQAELFRAYMNSENWQSARKASQNPTMRKFWTQYIKLLNVYLKTVPCEDIFTAEI